MSKEKKWNLISSAFCAGMAIFIVYLTLTTFVKQRATAGGPFANSAFYPRVLAGAIIFLSILLAATSLIKKREAQKQSIGVAEETVRTLDEQAESPLSEQDRVSKGILIGLPFILILYTILLNFFGYLVVTPFFMILLFWILKFKSWIKNIILSMISTFALYLIFAFLLNVILPQGRYSFISW